MKGHLVTANQHRAMFEAVNHRMWDITSGFTQWKINSCWPSVQWQIFDWFLRPMVSYYYIKKSCEPLHIQLDLLDSTVTVVNNHLEPIANLKVKTNVFDFDLNLIWEREQDTNINANTYKNVFAIPVIQDLTSVYFVKLELVNHMGEIISDNFYWLSTKEEADFKILQQLPRVRLDVEYEIEEGDRSSSVDVRVQNFSNYLAFFIHLAITDGQHSEEILPVFWEDNYFNLLPGESKEVSAAFTVEDMNDFHPSLKIDGWNIISETY